MTPITHLRISEARRGSRRRPLPVHEHVGVVASSSPDKIRTGKRTITADGTTIIRKRN